MSGPSRTCSTHGEKSDPSSPQPWRVVDCDGSTWFAYNYTPSGAALYRQAGWEGGGLTSQEIRARYGFGPVSDHDAEWPDHITDSNADVWTVSDADKQPVPLYTCDDLTEYTPWAIAHEYDIDECSNDRDAPCGDGTPMDPARELAAARDELREVRAERDQLRRELEVCRADIRRSADRMDRAGTALERAERERDILRRKLTVAAGEFATLRDRTDALSRSINRMIEQ